MNKPFSQACENNKHAIATILQAYVEQGGTLLEIGSGTGQHGAYMSGLFPKLTWQTSDRADYHSGILAWVNDIQCENFLPPLTIDVNTADWAAPKVDFVFSANTFHIMAWDEVIKFFEFISTALKSGGLLFIYGPFNYEGKFTSESNARFNEWLLQQGQHMAIRDFEAVNKLALNQGLNLISDNEMPANNRLLIWQST